MAHGTKVTPEMLDNAAKTATQTGEAIALNLQRLLHEIESQSSAFRGAAGASFQSVSAELGQELTNILQALNQMADGVSQSNQQFGSTDQDARNEISQVASQYAPGLGGVANALRG